MSLDNLRLPDDETLEVLDKLMQGGKKSTDLPVPALALHYLEALAIDPDSVYRSYQQPKGNGKMRLIEPPEDELKAIQRRILRVLNGCSMPTHVHGFAKGRSAYKGLRHMVDQVDQKGGDLSAVFSTDITDFFPSVKSEQVKETVFRYLIRMLNQWENGPKLPTEMVERLTDIISELCCLHGRLPQGAPTSPVLANMVGTSFDHQIVKAIPANQVYGRYADDIVVMGLERLEPKMQYIIKAILASFGFKINRAKTTDESNKLKYKIWGVEVLPKKTTGNKDSIVFKLPAALEQEWKTEILKYINSDDLPNTTADLLADSRYLVIMGQLSHAFTVTKFGNPAKVHKDFALPPKLAFAWKHLCKKFVDIMPKSHVNAFVAQELNYVTESEILEVTPEIFEGRIRKFLMKNNLDVKVFAEKLIASREKIMKLAEDEDEDLDIAISSTFYETLVDGYDDLSESERAEISLSMYSDLCAFVQLSLENKDKEKMTPAEKKIVKTMADAEESSLLPGDMYELWEDYRKLLGKDARGHKFHFWDQEKIKTHKLITSEQDTKKRKRNFIYLQGFKPEKKESK